MEWNEWMSGMSPPHFKAHQLYCTMLLLLDYFINVPMKLKRFIQIVCDLSIDENLYEYYWNDQEVFALHIHTNANSFIHSFIHISWMHKNTHENGRNIEIFPKTWAILNGANTENHSRNLLSITWYAEGYYKLSTSAFIILLD